MDLEKVGALLYRLRTEKGMTQKQVADRMNISDKAISKWERGLGCPDVSLLPELSALFEVNIERILDGDLAENRIESGHLRRVKFYCCPICGSITTHAGNAEISCCGRKLSQLAAKPADDAHRPTIENSDGDDYVTFRHEMSKRHYISFVAYGTDEKLLLIKLYPEQEPSARLPRIHSSKTPRDRRGRLYCYCNVHGLFVF